MSCGPGRLGCERDVVMLWPPSGSDSSLTPLFSDRDNVAAEASDKNAEAM